MSAGQRIPRTLHSRPMRLLYFLAIAAVVAAIWFRFRRGVKPAAPPAKPAPKIGWDPEPSYSAVSIKLGPDACSAARTIAGEHFSPQDAPKLPLEDCDQTRRCACGYNRETERREAGRRRTDDGLKDLIQVDKDRRGPQRRD